MPYQQHLDRLAAWQEKQKAALDKRQADGSLALLDDTIAALEQAGFFPSAQMIYPSEWEQDFDLKLFVHAVVKNPTPTYEYEYAIAKAMTAIGATERFGQWERNGASLKISARRSDRMGYKPAASTQAAA